MKTTFAVLALASVSAIGLTDEEKKAQEDQLYMKLDGYKGFYDGYYRSFYKINSHETVNENCLDEKTIENIVAMSDIINDPFFAGFDWEGLKAGTMKSPYSPPVKDASDTSNFDDYDEETNPSIYTGSQSIFEGF